jgi:hypothetical protein
MKELIEGGVRQFVVALLSNGSSSALPQGGGAVL